MGNSPSPLGRLRVAALYRAPLRNAILYLVAHSRVCGVMSYYGWGVGLCGVDHLIVDNGE